jgi:muramoyltetrapeptide carboxypeptidase
MDNRDTVKPPRLRPRDRVRFVSPASTPDPAQVARGAEILAAWGLAVEIGVHAFDTNGHY